MSASYANIHPIEIPVPADRQGAKRHYGVHPYFTRRPYNVVNEYILRYSREGDVVLDPFGGSGVTAIEAFLENRTGVQNDINPLANFIATGIAGLEQGELRDYKRALEFLRGRCEPTLSRVHGQSVDRMLKRLPLPPNIALPSNSDVARYHELFAPRQLASLALLKQAIEEIPNKAAKRGMQLAWSATLGKLNKTFLSAEGRAESRGGSSIFSIYRYKVAKKPVELPPWPTFEERARNVISAKAEIDKLIELKRHTRGWFGRFEYRSRDISELVREFRGQADYIFTDPPYGGHISYIDLSTLWNCWLGIMPDDPTRQNELIVGGEQGFSESTYVKRLGSSIASCLAMLKPNRWMSVVFQHWNVSYFEAILTSAAEAGAELKAAVSQVGDPIWSMHKKKGSESVLAGELILTFLKTGKKTRVDRLNGFDVSGTVQQLLSDTRTGKIYGESLFNKLVIAAWKHGAIGSINISKTEFIDLLQRNGWYYDEKNHYWFRELHTSTLFP
jgi:hypothetical protein